MAMAVSAVRFSPDEKEWIEAFAEMSGKSFSAQVREWVVERLEDELDARDLKLAVEKGADEVLSWEDVRDRYI